jgi:hypothetical protein
MIWNCYHFHKHTTKFTRNLDILKNSYLFKNDKKKNMSCTKTIINIYYNNLQKDCSKIHS